LEVGPPLVELDVEAEVGPRAGVARLEPGGTGQDQVAAAGDEAGGQRLGDGDHRVVGGAVAGVVVLDQDAHRGGLRVGGADVHRPIVGGGAGLGVAGVDQADGHVLGDDGAGVAVDEGHGGVADVAGVGVVGRLAGGRGDVLDRRAEGDGR